VEGSDLDEDENEYRENWKPPSDTVFKCSPLSNEELNVGFTFKAAVVEHIQCPDYIAVLHSRGARRIRIPRIPQFDVQLKLEVAEMVTMKEGFDARAKITQS